MFGEISLMAWMGSAIVFAIGGGAGFFIARQIKDKRTLELEQQLQATQSKLTDYQDDVNRHFLKSSLLFNKLTDNYREVYEHLATGAQKLCNEKPIPTALDLPDTKILSAAISTSTENVSEKTPVTNTAPPEASKVNAQTSEQPASEQHTAEQQAEEEHLGVESIAAHQTAFETTAATGAIENAETSPAENSSDDENAASVAQAVVGKSANQTENDTPSITEAELKILEASTQAQKEEDDVHLGAESTPGVELDHHKTHPAIH